MSLHRRAGLIAAGLLLAGAAGFGAAMAVEQPLQFHADLDGKSESPATQSKGTGRLEGSLDRENKVFTYTVTYQGLSGPVTAGHLHGPAEPGQNAGVMVPFQAPLASPIKGTAKLNDQQMQELVNSKMYVNLHTAANPNGEVRGQVLKSY